MADAQNVTLSLPRDLLKRAKRLAADRETSVPALMAEALARLTDGESWRVFAPTAADVIAAIGLQVEARIALWTR